MRHDAGDLGQGRDPQKYASYFRAFVRECKKQGTPFYFMANSHDPHRPFHDSPQDIERRRDGKAYPLPSRIFKAGEIKVPGFLPDLPGVREEMAQYCSSARRCDDTFGAVMKVLEDEGLAGNTLVVFLSDNGMSAPFSKTNAYNNSTRTPLIARLPGVTKAGSKDGGHFVSGIDFMPTVLEACGFPVPASVNGRSYLPLLRGEKQEGRERVFTQIYETSNRSRYPMFAVQDAKHILIYNPWADGKYEFRAESLGGLFFASMQEAARTDSYTRDRVALAQYRVPLELYDLEKDPDAHANQAKNPRYAGVLKEMSDHLKDWMRQYDPAPLAAFTALSSEKERSAYMTAQKQRGKMTPKKNKKDKSGKEGKKGKAAGAVSATKE
jgi:N-sulfoglucosamine sulfohydrolase